MKFNILKILIFLITFIFVNCQNTNEDKITYRANNIETLVIFSFGANGNASSSESQSISTYIDYFTTLVSLYEVEQNFYEPLNIPLELFFGSYNATELLNAANDDNNTIAIIVLKNNQEFIDNVTIQANDTTLTPLTKCNETRDLCDVISKFFVIPRDPLTKFNLVIFSNICPDASIFEEFHNFGDGISTETFLVSKAVSGNKQNCGYTKDVVTQQFLPKTDFNIVEKDDRKLLIDPTFEQKSKTAENYLLILVKEENYVAGLKFISDYYNDTTNCHDLEAPTKAERDKAYFITMRINYDDNTFKEITTIIPGIDFSTASFTLEEYLEHNLNYQLNNTVSKDPSFDISERLLKYNAYPQYVIIFTDDYNYLQNQDSKSLTSSNENRTVNYILYMDSRNESLIKTIEGSFYRNENDKAVFHVMTPESPGNFYGENICQKLNKAIPFEWKWWHFALIGVGVVAAVIALAFFYHKCIRARDLRYVVLEKYQAENKDEFSKEFDKLYIKEGKFKINFNVIKGMGLSSTVYEASIKRCLISVLPRASFDKNTSEDIIVAAKILNNLDQEDHIYDIIGEIEAARKLEKYDKICTLLGWSSHMGAPCLLFELMEEDLRSYLLSLREPLSHSGSERSSTVTSSVAESEPYSVPDFDDKQQKIFLQILWQASQGLEYIASKNIVHRDVAARNVLISRYGDSDTFTAKIADFGLCVNVNESTKEYQSSSNKRLPQKLFALECYLGHIFSEASDVWAFGLLMIEVYSLSAPLYPGILDLPEHLKEGKRMEKPEKMPQDIYELAYGCWKEDPHLRKPFYKLSKELKAKLRSVDPENYAYRDYWHLQIEDEELMESFIPRKLKTK